jgi:hypothetical protein
MKPKILERWEALLEKMRTLSKGIRIPKGMMDLTGTKGMGRHPRLGKMDRMVWVTDGKHLRIS